MTSWMVFNLTAENNSIIALSPGACLHVAQLCGTKAGHAGVGDESVM